MGILEYIAPGDPGDPVVGEQVFGDTHAPGRHGAARTRCARAIRASSTPG
jgi:hypothetical protein